MPDATPDPETQARLVIALALMEPVPAVVPCPPWCRRAGEHSYRDDGSGFWSLEREHVAAFEAHGVGVEIAQLERARTSSGPFDVGPVTAYLFSDEAGNALNSAQLRDAAHCLLTAADELERLTPDGIH